MYAVYVLGTVASLVGILVGVRQLMCAYRNHIVGSTRRDDTLRHTAQVLASLVPTVRKLADRMDAVEARVDLVESVVEAFSHMR